MSRMAIDPEFRHLTKTDFAYRELRRQILDGELPAGERLLLRPLADKLGLSVMPIRDALRMLERDGLVDSQTHRGATVTRISPEAILDMISIRMWLEVLAVREAVPRHTDDSLARVEEALADAEKTAPSGDALEFARANRTLHELVEAPAPAALREMIDDAWERVWQARRRMSLFSLVPGIAITAQRDHVELVDAVRRRDAAAASAAMERHRESTLESWRSALGELT
jgi:DNA-binding GntR family transcriptional regulator